MIQCLHRSATRLSLWAGRLAGAILVLIALMIGSEIALRNVFATSTFVSGEFVGYGVAAMTFLAMGNTLAVGELIRVRLFVDRLGRRGRQVVELAAAGLTLLATVLLAWFFFRSAARQWSNAAVSETIAETPLWIPQAVVLLGLVVFIAQLVAHGLVVAIDPDRAMISAEEVPHE